MIRNSSLSLDENKKVSEEEEDCNCSFLLQHISSSTGNSSAEATEDTSAFTCNELEVIEKIRELNDKYTNNGNTFGELTDGYIYTTKWEGREFMGNYSYTLSDERAEWVDMSRPRQCSFQKYDDETYKYKPVPILGPPLPPDNARCYPVELRGITLRQLRAIQANITRRCEKEGWKSRDGMKLSPKTVTLYDTNKYIIKPFTEEKMLSFVSCLPSTSGPQPPRFFTSHWWGEAVADFISCIEQFIRDNGVNFKEQHDKRGGGMTADTPIWICAYANNQHALHDDITVDPRQSGFTKAMAVSEGRTITILDKEGVVFSRVWCTFELFLTLVDKKGENGKKNKNEGLWAVYTAHPHTYTSFDGREREERDAIGIISGGATVDLRYPSLDRIAARQRAFPFNLVSKSLTIKIEEAEASEEADRRHILNCITGRCIETINEEPPKSHPKFEAVNDSLRATFASTVPNLQSALIQGDDVWSLFLITMLKGSNNLRMVFKFNDDGWKKLTEDKGIELVNHLPPTTTELHIEDANFGVGFVNSVSKHVRKTSKLEWLFLQNTQAGGEEGRKAGVRLADAVASNATITQLNLYDTDLLSLNNVEQWASALMTNETLKVLILRGVEDSVQQKLKEETKYRTPRLDIL